MTSRASSTSRAARSTVARMSPNPGALTTTTRPARSSGATRTSAVLPGIGLTSPKSIPKRALMAESFPEDAEPTKATARRIDSALRTSTSEVSHAVSACARSCGRRSSLMSTS